MEAIDPHCERLEPLFDQISVDVVEVTAQITPRERGQVAYPVDEKRRLGEIVFLGGWVCSTLLRNDHSEQEFRLDIDRGVQPVLLSADLHCRFVDGDLASAELRERHDVIAFWRENEEDRRLIKHVLELYSDVEAAREQMIDYSSSRRQ
jgi:hypothetical protein